MTNVLVTAVGGGSVGDQLVKALRLSDRRYRVVGADTDVTRARQARPDEAIVLPLAAAPGYVDALAEACARFDVSAVLPGSEAELRRILEARPQLPPSVKLVAVNDAKVLDVCLDKARTIEFLEEGGFPAPRTWLVQRDGSRPEIDRFPIILKPLRGGGSAHVYLAQDAAEYGTFLDYLLTYFPAAVVQEYVGSCDQEYTVGVLLDGDGTLLQSIALQRFVLAGLSNRLRVPNRTGRAELGPVLAVSSGVSQGRVVDFPAVTGFCEKVALSLGAKYAINVQCRVVDGQPYVFEINPRFSGTSSIRAMLGFNEPDCLIRKHVLGERIPARFAHRYGTVLRGLAEYEVGE